MARSSGATHVVQQAILMAIYAVFLGGVMTAFVAVGLLTFYPTPSTNELQIERVEQQLSQAYTDCKTPSCALTAEQQAQVRRLESERQALQQQVDQEMQQWSRTAGVIVVCIATLLLAVSLIRWDRAIVISNGLLLGGLFSMVFGIGLTLAGGEGLVRFLMITAALVITVVLGYIRFAKVQRRAPEAAMGQATAEVSARVTDSPPGEAADGQALPYAASTPESGFMGVDELERRVAEVERRLDRIRRAAQE